MSKVHLDFPKTELSLEAQLTVINIESEVLDNLFKQFKEIIPNLTNYIQYQIKEFSTENKTFNKEQYAIEVLQKTLSKKITHYNYVDYKDVLIKSPEGFKGNYLEYMRVLNTCSSEVYKRANNVLSDLTTNLSIFLSNKDAKITNKINEDVYKETAHHRQQVLNKINHYFPNRNTNAVNKLGTLINNFSELTEITKELKNFNSNYSKQNTSNIKSSLEKTVDLLNIVVKDVHDGGVTSISGVVAKDISNSIYEVAKYIELFALIRYSSETLIKSVEQTFTQLDNIMT